MQWTAMVAPLRLRLNPSIIGNYIFDTQARKFVRDKPIKSAKGGFNIGIG